MTAVAVTGMAWTTALGDDLDGVWTKLLAGATGIAPIASSYTLRNDRAAAIDSDYARSPRRRLTTMTDGALRAATQDAQISATRDAKTVFLVIGTSFGARLDDDGAATEPLDEWVNELAAGVDAIPIALSTACSSGSDAILLGAELIRSGAAEVCICGGADVLGDSKRLAHSALGTMSPAELRSFDRGRDGTVLGEGAGFMVLEDARAVKGRPIHALLRGCGSANDAAGLTAPDEQGEGVRLAVERSLSDAGLTRDQIRLVNAHGSGTPTNDRVESETYGSIFAQTRPLIFATKGAFGHTLGATGALEAIALVLGLNTRKVPPIRGLTEPIGGDGCAFARGAPAAVEAEFGLSVTIGFGGFNTSLVFERGATR